MIEIDDKIVSLDLLRECFACDLSRCKGICCVEGNAGAPLEIEEVATLEAQYETYKPYMTPEGIAAVERQGFMVVDDEGDYTTPLVGDAECAYSYTENGVTLCAVERAFREGRCSFRKPISCHLYPIRVVRFSNGTLGLNYHRWEVCRPAVECGRRLSIPVYKAQSIDHMRKLLQEIQQEIDCLEKEQAETLKPRKEPQPVESTEYVDGVIAVDTLPSGNDAVMIVLFNDNTWKYLRNRDYVKDSEIYTRCWDTTKLFPYRDVVKLADLPRSVDIELVDSLKCYHYPYKAAIRSKFGMRRRRKHQGVDLPLKTGDPIYATFNGKVRISIPSSKSGGYGNLIVIRHDNGLETFYGHLSERIVHADEWVEAGQIIGYGGSTGRSTGPHLHFETRYCGQSFDPERLIDFQSGNLRRETFLLKKSYLDIHSSASQDFEDEEAEANDEKRAEEARKALASAQYHRIRSGDTLGGIAVRYGTTVSRLCQLNGISRTTTLRIGRSLRVR